MPRYEFVEGSSSKFWEIERDGNSFTVRYGKIGSTGQSNTKDFGSEAETTKAYDKLVAEKVKKGYELVGGEEDGDEDGADMEIPEGKRNPELEQLILADLDAKEPWLVYADWLQSQDDPRGALIAAQAKGGKGAKKLLDQNKPALLGRFAPGGDLEGYVKLEWSMGFWSTARVGCDYDSASSIPEDVEGVGGVVGQLLAHPSSRFLRSLTLGLTEGVQDGEAEWQSCIDAVAEAGPRPTLRELFIGDYEQEETEISWTSIGSLAALWTLLPSLERLTVKGGHIELGAITAPKLKSLRLWTGGLPKEPVEQLGRASLPALERLEVWFGSEDYGAECTLDDLDPLLTGQGLPQVKWLGLMNSELANDLPARVAASALLPRLEVLDLSMGTMTSDGGRALLERSSAFKHLKQLNLDQNFISAEVAAQIKVALPQASIKSQQAEGDYVYVSVGE